MLLQGLGKASAYCLREFSSPPQEWSPSPPTLLTFNWWFFFPDYNGQQCPSLFHSPCHFSVPFPNLLGCSKIHAQRHLRVRAAGKAHPRFLAVNRGCMGLSHAPGWFPCCPVLSCSMCYLCFYPSTGHGDQEKCDWSRLKAVFHSSLTQLHSLFLPLSLSLFCFPQAYLFGMPFLHVE